MTRHALAAVFAALLGTAPGSADVKITSSYNSDGQASETTIYGNGTRLRYEFGKGLTLIRQCDLNRMVQVDDKARTFMTLPAEVSAAAPVSASSPSKAAPIDTNERKDMFGHKARHLKVTETAEAKHERTETDGWYIDLKDLGTCSGTGTDNAAGGYPVSYTVTTYGESGKATSTVSMRVTALVIAPLDAQLFEVPKGYTESGSQIPTIKTGAKAPGTVRVAAVALENQSGQNVQTNPAYNQLIGQLQAAQFDVVPLASGAPEAIEKKAKDNQCDYVLYTQLAGLEKPATGKVGGFLHKAPGIGHMTGGDALEARVAYRLVPASGGSPLLSSSVSAKSGGSFDWKAAALLASNVLPMTMAAKMLGGAFNPNMMSAMLSGKGSGGAMTSMDPMMSGLTMFLRATGPSADNGINPQNADAAIGAAVDQVGKAVVAQLKPATN